ncbi:MULTISPECIES: molecular chaperone DnaJ [Vibrio]|uniref:Molecular chaperone DnaJ n=1 Tax=Vibrio gallaecicus TaxID=552386 RepID=A0ABV4NGK5_9VIBR
MQEVRSNLYECKHCSGTGTCVSGVDGTSCLGCAKKSDLPFWSRKNHKGLLCGSCGGIGLAEPMTERLNKRITPLLAFYVVAFLLILIFVLAITKNPVFSEVLAFSSAVIGAVVGHYFSSKKAT